MDHLLLLVDSDSRTLTELKNRLHDHLGLEPLTAANAEEAIRMTKAFPVKIAVIALDLIDDKAYNLIPKLKKIHSGLQAIVTTGDYSEDAEKRSRACGLTLYLPKPLDFDILKLAVEFAWKNAMGRRAQAEALS